ncbi:MAG: 30S ribosome-binding factor RbfA [Armatimonadota bacterium]
MQTERQRRLGELVRAEISDILLREVRDPGLRGLVTITDVRVAADLSSALVYVSIYGAEEDAKATLEALTRIGPFIHALLRDRLDLRRIPTLLFRRDQTAARAQRIEETLRHLHEADAQRLAERASEEAEEQDQEGPGGD